MKITITKFPLASCYFLHLRYKYSP